MSFQRYLFLIGVLTVPSEQVFAFDPFSTNKSVSRSPASNIDVSGSKLNAASMCNTISYSNQKALTIDLPQAVEIALCNNPKTRTAWDQVKAAAANLGSSKAAYLPTVNLSVKQTLNKAQTTVQKYRQLDSNYNQNYTSGNLALNMVLFDFGGRSAQVKANQSLVLAAQASQNESLQQVFATTAKDYYSAVAAYQALALYQSLAQNAKTNLNAATAKVNRGFSPVTEQLQAQTAYDQMYFKQYKAQSDYNIALGALAADLGLRPDANIALDNTVLDAELPNTSFIKDIKKMIDEALQQYPGVLSAKAQVAAAKSQVDIAKAQGLPSLSLVGQASLDDQAVRVSLGQPYLAAHTTTTFVGVQLDVPLFSGFDRTYKVRKAKADLDTATEKYNQTVSDVSTSIWNNYQQFKTNDEFLRNTVRASSTAKLSLAAAEKRYRSGAGSIVELTSAQDALLNSQQQQIQAKRDWLITRMTLGASIGQLGMWAVTPTK